MQLKPEQLPAHLKQAQLKQGLGPIYLISGNEPLQLAEAAALIRQSARAMGFTERMVFHADARFDWEVIGQYADSPSLFGEKRLLDIRLSGTGPGQQGAGALARYASRPASDQIVLLIMGQLDAKQRKSKWYRSLEKIGVCIAIWPVDAPHLPRWIQIRARHRGITLTGEATGVLAERMEGNLLACAQEIEKLFLLYGSREIGARDVLQCVMDSAHFDPFSLVDSTLTGDARRAARILSGLREEGADPLPVLGMLAWEIREIAKIAHELAGGAGLDRIIDQQPALRRRKQPIASALGRRDAAAWLEMLCVAQSVDRIIKGAADADPWEALLGLALRIAGVEIPFPETEAVFRPAPGR